MQDCYLLMDTPWVPHLLLTYSIPNGDGRQTGDTWESDGKRREKTGKCAGEDDLATSSSAFLDLLCCTPRLGNAKIERVEKSSVPCFLTVHQRRGARRAERLVFLYFQHAFWPASPGKYIFKR